MNTPADEVVSSAYSKLGLDISKVILAAVTFFYGTGYLIQAITLRNYGVQRLETVKLQYIEVGVTFSVLLLLFTVLPVACFLAHFRIRKRSGLPHYRIGAFGYLLNTYNLLSLVLCFALFITQAEWTATLFNLKGGARPVHLYEIFVAYASVSALVLMALPLIERAVVAKVRRVSLVFWTVIEPLRYTAVVLGLALDLLLVWSFPWLAALALKGITFAASAMLLCGIAYVIVFYIRKLGDSRTIHVVAAVGTTGLFMLLYICINAYVYSVVRHIPMNRGGKLPLTRSFMVTATPALRTMAVGQTKTNECTIIGPVYVLEETEDYLHVANESLGDWHREWVPTFAVRKDEILYIRNERITAAGPRGQRRAPVRRTP